MRIVRRPNVLLRRQNILVQQVPALPFPPVDHECGVRTRAEGAGLDSLSNLVDRCSFRLMGIIGKHSKPSAQAVYDEVDWITAQIGKGRFKAAEAITKMLLAWGDLSAQLASENELFLQSMYLPLRPPCTCR